MRLSEIIGDFHTSEEISEDIEITYLSFDSRVVKDNTLFFALSGSNCNGEDYINQAIKSGAKAIVSTRKIETVKKVVWVIVDDVRLALSYFSANFYQNPQKSLKIIGVVGTNGKTSTCHILRQILEYDNKRTAVIGTLGVFFEGFGAEAKLTTPDPTDLFGTLRFLVDRGATYVVMEVSAHSIFLKKVAPIFFEALIFTNCTQDHLDYFESFEVYKEVKKSIFSENNARFLIVNSDDDVGREILENKQAFSFGIESPCDVFAVNVNENINGIDYVINLFDSLYEVNSSLLGLFNVYNTLCAALAGKLLGVSIEKIALAIKMMRAVDGRMEKVALVKGASVFVDYAHTPDGLEKSLLSLRKVTEGSLYCLFGCGGNRDKLKRPIMGRIAGDIADFVVVTSDNPRYEDAMQIILEVEAGVRESTLDYICIQSRKQAITYALKNLNNGDTLLIAGKGAETYQEILGVRHDFSDKQVVLDYIKNG